MLLDALNSDRCPDSVAALSVLLTVLVGVLATFTAMVNVATFLRGALA